MSDRKVIELAAKLSSTYLVKDAVDIHEPSEPSDLYWDTRMGVGRALGAMEGDLLHLKVRGLTHNKEWKAMTLAREELVNLFKGVHRIRPHDGMRAIIAWADKEKPNLLRLHQLITNEFQTPRENFPRAEAKGIPALLDFVDEIRDALADEQAQLGSTVPPPRMR
jgi:hypothetical protein